MTSTDDLPFVKGHGTGNDFVLIPDVDGERDLSAAQVRFLCDRHFGIGGDGVLRVVRTALVPEVAHLAAAAPFFMDHRNSDGSLAEMCGNGARVFVRYLREAGLVDADAFAIATRGGVRAVSFEHDGQITIDMGTATTPRARAMPIVEANGRSWHATGVLVPNPHAVAFVDDLADPGDLREAPTVVPADVFPDGVNVEFVVQLGPTHVAMRVHERGVGETLSCGTGACAVAWATARRQADAAPASKPPMRVDVPGGTVHVTERDDGRLMLSGPADIVARGTVAVPDGR